mmetsp:Transcript_15475/g.39184  ORF Transcript_15475/g.39184 Transcript_15475/m.39184 type:complete len:90 (+) Transcript_15475:206-475(+)
MRDSGCEALLQHFSSHPSLSILVVDGNPISAKGGEKLKELAAANPNIQMLDAKNTYIDRKYSPVYNYGEERVTVEDIRGACAPVSDKDM